MNVRSRLAIELGWRSVALVALARAVSAHDVHLIVTDAVFGSASPLMELTTETPSTASNTGATSASQVAWRLPALHPASGRKQGTPACPAPTTK